jgi:acyl transferase domain-containing protein
MRRPATFLAAMRATLADGHRHFIEVGPHPVLAEPMRQTAAAEGCTVTITGTMARGVDDVTTFETSLQSAAGRVQSNLRSSPRRKAEP